MPVCQQESGSAAGMQQAEEEQAGTAGLDAAAAVEEAAALRKELEEVKAELTKVRKGLHEGVGPGPPRASRGPFH